MDHLHNDVRFDKPPNRRYVPKTRLLSCEVAVNIACCSRPDYQPDQASIAAHRPDRVKPAFPALTGKSGSWPNREDRIGNDQANAVAKHAGLMFLDISQQPEAQPCTAAWFRRNAMLRPLPK